MENFTEIHLRVNESEKFEFEFEQNYQIKFLEKHWLEVVFWIIWFLAIESFGNLSLFATFAYEKYGMDPKKRTIINQLLTQISFIVIFLNILVLPPILWKIFIGPLYPFMAIFAIKTLGFLFFMYSLTTTEIMIFKCLFIWKWTWTVSRDENFYSFFALLFNLLISSLVFLQNIVLDDYSCNKLIKSLMHEVDTQIDSVHCTTSLNM